MFESFVKEKHQLLSYIQDIVLFAALKQDIDPALLYKEEDLKVRSGVSGSTGESRIKQDSDVIQVKNRIIIIVSI